MKHTRFAALTLVSLCVIVLASFKIPAGTEPTYMDKNIVFKISYDASVNKLVALEKLEVNNNYIARGADGKIMNVNKDAIVSEMPMATKIQTESMGESNATSMFALVTYHTLDKAGGNIPTDEKMLDFLKTSHDSFTKNNFAGSDYTISGKNWSCSGPSCGFNVPAGVEVYVWQ